MQVFLQSIKGFHTHKMYLSKYPEVPHKNTVTEEEEQIHTSQKVVFNADICFMFTVEELSKSDVMER